MHYARLTERLARNRRPAPPTRSCTGSTASFISDLASGGQPPSKWEIFCLSCGGSRLVREGDNLLEALRTEVLEANLELVRRGLVIFTFGNASAVSRAHGLCVIKPSGVPYERMTPA